MFHVALIYTCDMKENALASCISYARSQRVESGVGAWSFLFTGVGWDSGCEHEGSHLMHDMEHFI